MTSTSSKRSDPNQPVAGAEATTPPNPWLVLLSVGLGLFMVVVDVDPEHRVTADRGESARKHGYQGGRSSRTRSL